MYFHLFQYIFVVIAIISIFLIYRRYKNNKTTLPSLILWIIIWIFLTIVAFMPQIADRIAFHFGLGSGANFIIIASLIGCFYLIFLLYDRLDKQEQNINDLVRELAIRNEIVRDIDDLEKNDEKKNKKNNED